MRPRSPFAGERDWGRTHAMVLAAGRGERMRPLSDVLPKPLLEAGGKPLIDYHLRALSAAGIRTVVINVAWQGERIRTALGDGAAFGVHIHYVDEGDLALETGGGIFNALPHLGAEPFVVVNADIWTDFPLTALDYRPDSLAHLVLVPNPAHHPDGDFALNAGQVTLAGELQHTFAGIGVYRRELFRGCSAGVFPLAPILRKAICAGRVSGQLYEGRWLDVGTPERLETLNRSLETP